jgi:NodT family efflux transporter outer membrane factor (OMF) lipoprotein
MSKVFAFPFPLLRAAVIAMAALAGCAAVGPDYTAPQPQAPATWQDWRSGQAADGNSAAIDTTTVPGDWWTQFDDPTLNQLQERAAQASPDLRTAALRFAQSRMQRVTVAAQHGPALSAAAGVSRQRQSEFSPSTRIAGVLAPANREQLISVLSEPFTLYQAGFDASWELDLWGRVRRSIEAADAEVDQSAALLNEVRLAVASELARGYFELRRVQRQYALLDEDVRIAGDSLSLMQARAQGGLIDQRTVSLQRSQLADLVSHQPALRAQEAALINQIGLLVDAHPGELEPTLASRAGVQTTKQLGDDQLGRLPDLSLGLPSDVALRRPDIQAAQARLHAATANIGVAQADLYPRITLGASFGLESFEGNHFGDWGARSWSVGPSLSLPLFDQGRRRATIELRELSQQQAAVVYQQTVLKAWQEIDDALTGYDAERGRNAQLREKENAGRDAYDLARAQYDGGLTDFLAQLDAERTWLQARRDLSDSDHQLRLRLIAIYKALGA